MSSKRLVVALKSLLLALALVAPASCESGSGGEEASGGGETHFLKRCDPSADACGSELACLCGVCTRLCSAQNSCESLAAAECVAECGGRCDVSCEDDADCAAVSDGHRCEQGVCRAGQTRCADDGLLANQVLLIGDSFFAASHQITAYLEDRARSTGALGAGERYRDNSRLVANGLAVAGNGIADQYMTALEDAEVALVLMNGGGADVLLGSCDVPDATCPVLADAANAASDLLARMADDGVEQVVYVFYPDPADADVRAKIDGLRPLIQGVCESSPVPCHFLDLRPTFEGRYAEYIQGDGLNPTASGSEAAAAAIWATMQEFCIAQ